MSELLQFPLDSILPKKETQVAEFLHKYPKFDGRGIIVAIFDSGVDVKAPGLQASSLKDFCSYSLVTSDGRPKIVDAVDCSGSGDVDMSTIRKVEKGDVVIEGVSGKKLKIGEWKNPKGEYRVGIKRVFDLVPSDVAERIKTERKKDHDAKQRIAVTNLEREIDAWNKKFPNKTSAPTEETDRLKDLEAQLQQLNELDKSYNDPGPILDCVVFHDGGVWRAAIDIEESGDLSKSVLFTDFKSERQIGTFSKLDMMNFSINIFDDGKILSIVTHCSSHGTHVAGIVGAYFPDQPELNGIAPGVQLVSVKIGDARLKTEETGSAMVRGLIVAVKNKCSLINMSYGEPTKFPDTGRFIELSQEIIHKHNILFVSSAGNHGPGLSTVGCPGATTTDIIGVGAYVSPGMQSVDYSMLEKLPENLYTWSSRGPTYSGSLGVSVCSHGGAISPVPNSTLKKSELMNGTSMSSPSCCGAISLLLSGLKAQGLDYSPTSVRRAIENTARVVDGVEPFATGHGLIQVLNSFDFLLKHSTLVDFRFKIKIPSRANANGIYLREWEETQKDVVAAIFVETIFREGVDNSNKIEFEKRVLLRTTKPWIKSPEYLVLMNNERSFNIKVSPQELDENGVHFGEVIGLDFTNPSAGPLFRVPVTVIRPSKPIESKVVSTHVFGPGIIKREFWMVPKECSYVRIKIRGKELPTPRRYALQLIQVAPPKSYRETYTDEYFELQKDGEETFKIPVIGGFTIEICIAQYWNSLGASKLEWEVEFHGLKATNDSYHLNGNCIQSVEVQSSFRGEIFQPKVNFTHVLQTFKPESWTLQPLGIDRDLLPNGKQIHQLILSYKFKVEEGTKVKCRIPSISDLLYESPLESQLWTLCDANKQPIGWGDAWPEHYETKVDKGDYTLRIQLRHDQVEILEKFKGLALQVEHQLANKVNPKIFGDLNGAITGTKELSGERKVHRGKRVTFYVKMGESPKIAKEGDLLIGSLLLNATEEKISIPFSASLPSPERKKDPSPSSSSPIDKSTELEKLETLLLKQKVDFLSKLVDTKKLEDFHKISKDILVQYPTHLPLLHLQLKAADSSPERGVQLNEVVKAADVVIDTIDTTKLAVYFGTKHDTEDPQEIKLKEEMEKQREILQDAFYRKELALYDQNESVERVKENHDRLKQWVDLEDVKFIELYIKYLRKKGQLGLVLKTIRKAIDSAKDEAQRKQLFDQQLEVIKELKWTQWEKNLSNLKIVKFPKDFPPF